MVVLGRICKPCLKRAPSDQAHELVLLLGPHRVLQYIVCDDGELALKDVVIKVGKLCVLQHQDEQVFYQYTIPRSLQEANTLWLVTRYSRETYLTRCFNVVVT